MAQYDDIEERRPMLSSRQIGLAAAFGGAAFAFRALGLAIPVVPPLIIDPGALMPILAGMAGGPLVGAIVGIARGIPSGTPAVDLWVQPIKGIYWAYAWKYLVLRIKDVRKRWVFFAIITFLLQFFVEAPMSIGGNALILKIYPFYPTWPFTLGWYNIIYAIFQYIVFAAVVRAFPGIFGWDTGKVTW